MLKPLSAQDAVRKSTFAGRLTLFSIAPGSKLTSCSALLAGNGFQAPSDPLDDAFLAEVVE